MKILFWFNGSGGQRRERKIMDFPNLTLENLKLHDDIIMEELDEWRHNLRSNSEYQQWGWDENFSENNDPISHVKITEL